MKGGKKKRMRMWMVDPRIMCRKHLLGEHLEIHMFASVIKEKKQISGYIKGNLLEIQSLETRHKELAQEMVRRGYRHQTPLEFSPDKEAQHLDPEQRNKKIDPTESLRVLISRCNECKNQYHHLLSSLQKS
jgi:hypothetical protein